MQSSNNLIIKITASVFIICFIFTLNGLPMDGRLVPTVNGLPQKIKLTEKDLNKNVERIIIDFDER